MSVMNQAAMEAVSSATYLENYLNCVDRLPDDLQRTVSQLRELDMQTDETLNRAYTQKDSLMVLREEGGAGGGARKTSVIQDLQRTLVRVQEIGDLKLSLVAKILEQIEEQSRILEQDHENLEPASLLSTIKEDEPATPSVVLPDIKTRISSTSTAQSLPQGASTAGPSIPDNIPSSTGATPRQSRSDDITKTSSAGGEASSTVKRQHRRRATQQQEPSMAASSVMTSGLAPSLVEDKKIDEEKPRKKKTKKEKTEHKSPVVSKLVPIDPDEPKYCLCHQVSYGEMIGCDNQNCAYEWFHFNCVNLTHKPKGRWYCPRCRGDKPNVMNPDLLEMQRKERALRKNQD